MLVISDVSVVGVDLLEEKNEEQCHTDEYESEKYLIVRRGHDLMFQVRISWHVQWNPSKPAANSDGPSCTVFCREVSEVQVVSMHIYMHV